MPSEKFTNSDRMERSFETVRNCIDNECIDTRSRESPRSHDADDSSKLRIGNVIFLKQRIKRFDHLIEIMMFTIPTALVDDIPVFVEKTEIGGFGEGVNKEVHCFASNDKNLAPSIIYNNLRKSRLTHCIYYKSQDQCHLQSFIK